MKENPECRIPRRDLLRLTVAGSGAAAIGALLPGPAPAQSINMKDKRRARYQPDPAKVRDFYRVNSYPGRPIDGGVRADQEVGSSPRKCKAVPR